MNKYHELMRTIAGEYHIERGEQESHERWKARTVYSLLGRMACASLSDSLEEDELISLEKDEMTAESGGSVSITHFKRRIESTLKHYLSLYPEISTLFPTDLSERKRMYKDIYETFVKSGCVYHKSNEIKAAAPCTAAQDSIWFERGMPLDRHQYISGLGAYLPIGLGHGKGQVYPSVREMFCLLESTLSEFWADLVSTADWHPLQAGADMEYLPHHSPYYHWRNVPLKDCLISVSRIGQPGSYLYYLYQIRDGQLLGSQLPQWLVNDPFYDGTAYRIVTNACLAANFQLPTIQYKMDGPIVQVTFKYLPSPAELFWIKLYSWPTFFLHFPGNFRRIFSLEVFKAIKPVLEQIGYQFTEE